MRAITIRRNGALLCFGPENGMYNPRTPDGCTRAVEPDYDTVFAEWVGRVPDQAEVDAQASSRFDNMDKTEKAILLLLRSYCNALQAGTYTNKTIPQLNADFVTAFKAVP